MSKPGFRTCDSQQLSGLRVIYTFSDGKEIVGKAGDFEIGKEYPVTTGEIATQVGVLRPNPAKQHK